ncbi:uncharacterized protein LOC129272973 [Lytechinus pictus]|uniref:uncharacterized protein LOC129272973 n=1 Tax=Lytechinus pictus TaxID=7653 RepID=UPI00240D5262|nr:uncharacterized protein LOC129272973 [Lytechinus pictus]
MAACSGVDLSWLDEGKPRKRRTQPDSAKRSRPGKPAVHEQFPIVDAASEFIEGHGFRAHRRRQDVTGTCGSSLPEVRDHLLAALPGLKEAYPKLGTRTVARLMKPPNQRTTGAKRYKGFIQARIPAKDNSQRKGNDNSHFYASRVRYCMEMAAKLGDKALVFSADNKNKVRVGATTLAVDRRITIKRFYPVNDAPQYLDHDFPTPGYAITPSGYLEMCPLSTPATTIDHLGREQLVLPQKTRSTVVLRSPHSPNNVTSHLNDLVMHAELPTSIAHGKSCLFLLVDGGPDCNTNHQVNLYFYAKFFKDMNLDAMCVTSYAPGDSALNPVEHLWAPCTKALTSVYLPSTLPGETVPPCQQHQLSMDERLQKEHQVFDSAMDQIRKRYWSNVRFAGHKVNVKVEKSGGEPRPYGTTYQQQKAALAGSTRALRQSGMMEMYRFASRHMDKRIGTVIFAKCLEPSCEHCSSHPPQVSPGDLHILRNFPTPKPSSDHGGHFITFLEACKEGIDMPCEHMPLYKEKGLGRCDKMGCRYVFGSKKDVEDHRRKVHGR